MKMKNKSHRHDINSPKANDNFAIKVISMENVEWKSSIFKKNMEEARWKNQTDFFPFFNL